MHRSKTMLFTFVLACFLTAASQATTVLPVEVSEAVDTAELIFTGHVVTLETATSRDGLYPFTFVTFEIAEVIKGSVDGTDLTLRFEGGDLEELKETLEVVGMPQFELGNEVLLFVQSNGTAACPLVGWWQGRLDFQLHPSSGKRLLVDHRGRVVEGVDTEGWRTEAIRYDKDEERLINVTPKAQLLWQEGVVVKDDTHSKTGEYQGIEAGAVLDDLRQLVETRRLHKSFLHPETVSSANPLDTPASMAVTPVAPIH